MSRAWAAATAISVTDPASENPMSRRLVVEAWAPGNAQTSKLPPCHAMFVLNAPRVTFTFRASAGGRVLAQASQNVVQGPTTSCDPMSLTIEGRSQTALLGGSGFLAAVGKLLGLALAASG